MLKITMPLKAFHSERFECQKKTKIPYIDIFHIFFLRIVSLILRLILLIFLNEIIFVRCARRVALQ